MTALGVEYDAVDYDDVDYKVIKYDTVIDSNK